MNRRIFLQVAAGASAAAQNRSRQAPNIVLLLADDLGSADLSCFGASDINTPAIDSLAKDGVQLTRCYANPECTPSRAALLTGRYVQRIGGLECAIGVGNVGRYDEAVWLQQRGELGLPVSEITIARMLKDHGYDTACIGKWHLGYLDKFSPNAHGFDEYFGILGGNADYFAHTEQSGDNVLRHNGRPVKREGYLTDLIGTSAVNWLKARKQNPFFLYVPFNAPHSPYQGPDDRLPREHWNRGTRSTYVEMVEAMDRQVGAILSQLASMGVRENTIVIFLSDNGGPGVASNAPLRGKKSSCWEGGIRTPCLVSWPAGGVLKGKKSAQVTTLMDLTATILSAASVAPPSGRKLDGVDMLPVLRGSRQPFSRTVFWRYKRGDTRRKAVLDGEMKYVYENGKEELHDLAADMREERDLLAAKPEVAERLRSKLTAWETEVRAPRLRDFPRDAPSESNPG